MPSKRTVDPRWEHGDPPKGNANFGWLQHMLYHRSINPNKGQAEEDAHLYPDAIPNPDATPGVASMALLLANGSMSSNTKGEGEIRSGVVKADLVECMGALPGQLFTNTQIPACIWFLTKTKQKRGRGAAAFRDRAGEVLFIDARKVGYMVDRVLRAFTDEDTARIVSTAWKRGPIVSGKGSSEKAGNAETLRAQSHLPSISSAPSASPRFKFSSAAYEDIAGFCKSATLDEIAEHGNVLTPGRYVGAEEVEDDGVLFAEKREGLTRELATQFHESEKLQSAIRPLPRLDSGVRPIAASHWSANANY